MSHLLVGPSDLPRFCFLADEAQVPGRGTIDICSYGGRPSFTEALSPYLKEEGLGLGLYEYSMDTAAEGLSRAR